LHTKAIQAESARFNHPQGKPQRYIRYGEIHSFPSGYQKQDFELIAPTDDAALEIDRAFIHQLAAIKEQGLRAEAESAGRKYPTRPTANVLDAATRLISFQQAELRREVDDAVNEAPILPVLDAIELTNLEEIAFVALWSSRRQRGRGIQIRRDESGGEPLTVCRRCGGIFEALRSGKYCSRRVCESASRPEWSWGTVRVSE
jgi:hypothetical protein